MPLNVDLVREIYNKDSLSDHLMSTIHLNFIIIKFDISLQPTARSDFIDEKVIDGHVIPHHVLFTKATPESQEFESLAFSDNVKVIISFSVAVNGQEELSKL